MLVNRFFDSMKIAVAEARIQRRRHKDSAANARALIDSHRRQGTPVYDLATLNEQCLESEKNARLWGKTLRTPIFPLALSVPAGFLGGMAAATAVGLIGLGEMRHFLPSPGYEWIYLALPLAAFVWQWHHHASTEGDGKSPSTPTGNLLALYRIGKGCLAGLALGALLPFGATLAKAIPNPADFYNRSEYSLDSHGAPVSLKVGYKFELECAEAAREVATLPKGYGEGSALAAHFKGAEGARALSALVARHPELSSFSFEYKLSKEPELYSAFSGKGSPGIGDTVGLKAQWIANIDGRPIARGDAFCPATSTSRRAYLSKLTNDSALLAREARLRESLATTANPSAELRAEAAALASAKIEAILSGHPR